MMVFWILVHCIFIVSTSVSLQSCNVALKRVTNEEPSLIIVFILNEQIKR